MSTTQDQESVEGFVAKKPESVPSGAEVLRAHAEALADHPEALKGEIDKDVEELKGDIDTFDSRVGVGDPKLIQYAAGTALESSEALAAIAATTKARMETFYADMARLEVAPTPHLTTPPPLRPETPPGAMSAKVEKPLSLAAEKVSHHVAEVLSKIKESLQENFSTIDEATRAHEMEQIRGASNLFALVSDERLKESLDEYGFSPAEIAVLTDEDVKEIRGVLIESSFQRLQDLNDVMEEKRMNPGVKPKMAPAMPTGTMVSGAPAIDVPPVNPSPMVDPMVHMNVAPMPMGTMVSGAPASTSIDVPISTSSDSVASVAPVSDDALSVDIPYDDDMISPDAAGATPDASMPVIDRVAKAPERKFTNLAMQKFDENADNSIAARQKELDELTAMVNPSAETQYRMKEIQETIEMEKEQKRLGKEVLETAYLQRERERILAEQEAVKLDLKPLLFILAAFAADPTQPTLTPEQDLKARELKDKLLKLNADAGVLDAKLLDQEKVETDLKKVLEAKFKNVQEYRKATEKAKKAGLIGGNKRMGDAASTSVNDGRMTVSDVLNLGIDAVALPFGKWLNFSSDPHASAQATIAFIADVGKKLGEPIKKGKGAGASASASA